MKHFRAHLGNIAGLSVDAAGRLLATVSNDESLKVFDVVNFGKKLYPLLILPLSFAKIFLLILRSYGVIVSIQRGQLVRCF